MNICVFGASSSNIAPEYFAAAKELGALMAHQGHCLVFGGGKSGLMGACAQGVLENGGKAIGIAPRFFDEPDVLLVDECSEFIFTETMAERKSLMEDKAEAFIALPGGIGTYEEFFEVMTLKQLGRHGRSMCLLNTLGYFEPFVALLEATADKGFMSRNCLELYKVCNTPAQALAHALTAEENLGSIRRLSDYNK